MKKHILNGKMLLLLCTLLVSCAKEMSFDALQTSREREKVFFVDFDDATKSFRDENGHNGFCIGDTIRYFGNASKEVRTSLIQDDGTIRCQLAEEDTVITAVYGGTDVEIRGENSFIINETDKATSIQDGKFSTAQKCIAKVNVTTETLAFKNANSLIKFSLRNKEIAYAYFYANDGIAIAGRGLYASIYNGQASTSPSGDACVSFIPIILDGSGEYYISLASYTYMACGFTIEFCDKQGNYIGSIKHSDFFNTNKNDIINLGVLDERIQYENTIYVISPNNYFYSDSKDGYLFGNRGHNGKGISVSVNNNSKSDINPNVGPFVTNVQLQNNNDPSNIVSIYTDDHGNVKGFATNDGIYEVTQNENSYIISKANSNSNGYYEYENIGYVPKTNTDNINFDGGAYFPSEVLTMYKIASSAVGFTLALAQSGLQGSIKQVAQFSGEEVASYWGGSGVTQLLAIGGIFTSSVSLGLSIGQISVALAVGAVIPGGIFVAAALSAVSLAYSYSTLVNSMLLDIQDKEVKRLYADLTPVPLDMETTSETSVVLHCAVNGYMPNVKIGIILADGAIINHKNYLQKKSVEIQEDQTVYSFEFSGLRHLKAYRYRAYLTTDYADNHWQDFCKYSKEIKEFTLIHAVKMSDGTEWATCNAGAQYPWEKGRMFNKRSEIENIYPDWRLPRSREVYALYDKASRKEFVWKEGVRGWEIEHDGKILFLPMPRDMCNLYYTDWFCVSYALGSYHPDYGRDIWREWYIENGFYSRTWGMTWIGGAWIGDSLVRLVRKKDGEDYYDNNL